MKLLSIIRKGVIFSIGALMMQSCLKDDDYNYSIMMPNALVTVKTDANNKPFLQLDDETTLLPVNISESPYNGKEVRALVNYKEIEEPSGSHSKAVHVNWMDSILTKKPVLPLSTEEEMNKVYGNDPVEIINDWVTIAEDGYLTLRFRTDWGGNPNIKHLVNLVVVDKDNYIVEFRHNAYGDTNGHVADALVAFKLDEILPDTKGKTVKLTLKWKAYTEDKSHEFEYCTNKGTDTKPEMTKNRTKNFIQ